MPSLFGARYSRADLLRRVGRFEQAAGVRLVTAGDGVERGVRFLEFRTGTGFVFDVIVDRAFDIGRCEMTGTAMAWMSPVGVPGPWFAEPENLGWFRFFPGGSSRPPVSTTPCWEGRTLRSNSISRTSRRRKRMA